jgi:outer membrane protein, heavy metal efflux system
MLVNKFQAKMRPTHILLFLLFLLLHPLDCIHGQQVTEQSGNPILTLDLQQAIQYATTNNAGIIALQKRKAVADAEILIEKQRINPSFVGETTRSQPNYFVGGGYLFELGGKRKDRIEIANHEAEVAQSSIRAGLQSLRHDMRVAFYKVILLQEKYKQIEMSRDLARKLDEISHERYQAGDVAKFEVLQTELELKRRENELKRTDGETESARIELNLLLNRNPQEGIDLKGAMEDVPNILPLDSLVERASSGHVEIQSILQEQKAEEARLSLARAARIPDLDVEGGTEIDDADFEYGWRAALRLELPVFNQKKGEIARSTAVLESLKAEESSIRQTIRARIAEAYFKFRASEYQTEQYRLTILPAAGQIEQLSQESYQEGKTGILSAIDAQRNMHQVRIEYLDALMDYQTAVADLEFAAGTGVE